MIFELGTKQRLWLTREVFPHRDVCACACVCARELVNLNDASSKGEVEFFFSSLSVETNQHHEPNLAVRLSIYSLQARLLGDAIMVQQHYHQMRIAFAYIAAAAIVVVVAVIVSWCCRLATCRSVQKFLCSMVA